MPWVDILYMAVGLTVLVAGAEFMVRGAVRLAASFGVSSLIIGLTVVAFGTSAPELAVSVRAAVDGKSDLAVGNVVGSNICNVLLILGLSAMITPLLVKHQLIRFDVPLMIGVSVLFLLFSLDLNISRFEGGLLFAGICAYTLFLLRFGGKESAAVIEEYEKEFGPRPPPRRWLDFVLLIGGLGMLVIGSQSIVDGAVGIARWLGVGELIIGLTIVAVGTSLPEVATSVVAAFRGERDIAVGNVVGSNLFNILSVLGLTGLVAPEGVRISPAALAFDIPVMVAVAVVCLPIFFANFEISRWNGWLFFGYYVAYMVFLIFDATEHDALPHYRNAMVYVVFPLTVVGIVVPAVRFYLHQRKEIHA